MEAAEKPGLAVDFDLFSCVSVSREVGGVGGC